MNKPLFNFVKISILTIVLFFSLGNVYAATTANTTQTKEKGVVDKVVDLVAPKGSVLATMFPSTKNCDYVNNKQYQPFSGIDKTFPGAKTLNITEVKDRNGTEEDKMATCINVAGGTEGILKIFFTLSISIIIIMSVVNISISGIQFMTEEATGQIKGGARKRLQNSFIALGLGLLSYTILYTVNKQLVAFNFNPESIDKDGSINKGIESATKAAGQGAFSTAFGSIEALRPGLPNSPYLTQPGVQPSFNETLSQGNISTPVGFTGFGSIRCQGYLCVSEKTTVFGYKDGDGTVGNTGDNGIGNARWSTKPGCTYDTGNTTTLGVALPQNFWRGMGIPFEDVKYIGVKLYVNGVFKKVLPVVDDSQLNLDLTFAAARAYIDPTITNSNRLNTSGKKVSFEIIKDYYKTNPKTNIVWTSNKSTFTNKIPCNI